MSGLGRNRLPSERTACSAPPSTGSSPVTARCSTARAPATSRTGKVPQESGAGPSPAERVRAKSTPSRRRGKVRSPLGRPMGCWRDWERSGSAARSLESSISKARSCSDPFSKAKRTTAASSPVMKARSTSRRPLPRSKVRRRWLGAWTLSNRTGEKSAPQLENSARSRALVPGMASPKASAPTSPGVGWTVSMESRRPVLVNGRAGGSTAESKASRSGPGPDCGPGSGAWRARHKSSQSIAPS